MNYGSISAYAGISSEIFEKYQLVLADILPAIKVGEAAEIRKNITLHYVAA